MNRVVFKSERHDWTTPKDVYNALDAEFHFDFDPCHNGQLWDGLSVEWGKSNFVNPPYRAIGKWISKGFDEWRQGKTCVFLIPSRTDTRWFHDYAMKASEIRFIKGRLKFGGSKNAAPFPSCIVVFRRAEAVRGHISALKAIAGISIGSAAGSEMYHG